MERVVGSDGDGGRQVEQRVESDGDIGVEAFASHLLAVALGIPACSGEGERKEESGAASITAAVLDSAALWRKIE